MGPAEMGAGVEIFYSRACGGKINLIGGESMKIDIDRLTEEELIALNRRIVERLKFLESMRAHKKMMQFNIGQRVSFEPPGRVRQVGVLTKFNKKTATVVTETGQSWNVSPHFLAPVRDARESGGNTNVIEIGGKPAHNK